MEGSIPIIAGIVVVVIFTGVMVAMILVLWYQMNRIDDLTKQHNKPKVGRPLSLTENDMVEIRRLLAEGMSKTDIAELFGVSRPTLYAHLKEEK